MLHYFVNLKSKKPRHPRGFLDFKLNKIKFFLSIKLLVLTDIGQNRVVAWYFKRALENI